MITFFLNKKNFSKKILKKNYVKFSKILILFFIITYLFINNKEKKLNNFYEFYGTTMGTYWKVCLETEKKNVLNINKIIQKNIKLYEQQLSIWKKNSLLYNFNKYFGTKKIIINEDIKNIILLSLKINKKTNGALDITIAPLVNLWGFGPENKYTIPNKSNIEKLRNITGINKLVLIEKKKIIF